MSLSLIASLFAGAGSPFTAVGHDEVIKMEYFIGIGRIDTGVMEIPLAWTSSYLTGVSLSEIRWGFYNTGESGTTESAKLEFTLHDIAGQTLSNFIRIKSGGWCIFFRGPTSSGFPWWGADAIYYPTPDSCDLQFSQTQGFTYRFSAVPIGNISKTAILAAHSKVTINGLNEGNVAHGNTFKDYLEELEVKWNKMISESPEKAGTAKIKIQMRGGEAANDEALTQSPVITEQENKGQNVVRTGDPSAKIKQIEFSQLQNIAEVIKSLWQKRFVSTETSPEKGISQSSHLEVNFAKYEAGTSIIDVKCHKTTVTDDTSYVFPICVGTDDVCSGFPYRAQIAAINFKGLFTLLAADKLSAEKGTGPLEPSQAGNQEHGPIQHAKTHDVSESTQKENTLALLSLAAGMGRGNNPMYDGWGEFNSLKSVHKNADFTIDLDMPYTFAFTPQAHGGLLKDSIPGDPMGGIDIKVGAFLFFWWYTDPHCQDVSLVRELTTKYRITKVQHTIGLSGNTTQVSLSHLNVGN